MRKQSSMKPAKNYLAPEQRKGKRLAPPEPYRSWLEADVARDLERRGVGFAYESLTIIYTEPAKVRKYTPDFPLDNKVIVEVKGRWTAQDRRKMGEVIEQNPDLDIRLLFAKDNPISKKSRTRYSDWCTKRNIQFAIGTTVPEAWVT